MNNPAVFTNVTKDMNDFTFGPINFSLEDGMITAIVGRNGSGKSTLLKMLMNLVKPTDGMIQLFGDDVGSENESWKEHIAYQPQTTVGYDPFTGNQLKQLIAPYYPHWDDEYFSALVKRLNVTLNKRFNKMSQGNQQKLILALTFARNTRLLLLDEPTSFLDIPSKKELMKIITEWMDSGDRSIIITSHQAEDINKLADYIAVMKEGQLAGTYEKDLLSDMYGQYWVKEETSERLAGEIARDGQIIVSNNCEATEQDLHERQLTWEISPLGLEDMITILLDQQEGMDNGNNFNS